MDGSFAEGGVEDKPACGMFDKNVEDKPFYPISKWGVRHGQAGRYVGESRLRTPLVMRPRRAPGPERPDTAPMLLETLKLRDLVFQAKMASWRARL